MSLLLLLRAPHSVESLITALLLTLLLKPAMSKSQTCCPLSLRVRIPLQVHPKRMDLALPTGGAGGRTSQWVDPVRRRSAAESALLARCWPCCCWALRLAPPCGL